MFTCFSLTATRSAATRRRPGLRLTGRPEYGSLSVHTANTLIRAFTCSSRLRYCPNCFNYPPNLSGLLPPSYLWKFDNSPGGDTLSYLFVALGGARVIAACTSPYSRSCSSCIVQFNHFQEHLSKLFNQQTFSLNVKHFSRTWCKCIKRPIRIAIINILLFLTIK